MVLCCAGAGYAASRARPSLFHKLCMPHRYRGCAHWNVGQCCISWAGVCFAVSVWFFHLGDNSYPMRDLCSMYFTTPCANQNPALNFFTTKETRTLPCWLLTGHLVMLQPRHVQKPPTSVEINVMLMTERLLFFPQCGWRSGALTRHEISGVRLLLKKEQAPDQSVE